MSIGKAIKCDSRLFFLLLFLIWGQGEGVQLFLTTPVSAAGPEDNRARSISVHSKSTQLTQKNDAGTVSWMPWLGCFIPIIFL